MIHPYASRQYAELLAEEVDRVIPVPEWGLCVLRRPIEGMAVADAVGCYPVAVFGENIDIQAGLDRLRDAGLVSVVFVADPFFKIRDNKPSQYFDIYKEFKTHYFHRRTELYPAYSKHHRYELRRADAEIREIGLAEHMADWLRLYEELVSRHHIVGTAAFSVRIFQRLADLDGLVSFGAFVGGELVACHLWVRCGDHMHSHLAASSETGRRHGAAYLLYDAAFRRFDDVKTFDLGGGAGLEENSNDGLARFKRGFSNCAKSAYLCGKVLDPARYSELSGANIDHDTGYFPAYRASMVG